MKTLPALIALLFFSGATAPARAEPARCDHPARTCQNIGSQIEQSRKVLEAHHIVWRQGRGFILRANSYLSIPLAEQELHLLRRWNRQCCGGDQ